MILPYRREEAVRYAHTWAYKRNPGYYDFDRMGGDCSNFISQSLYAGTGVMNYIKTFGWYYIDGYRKSPSWSGVDFLHQFLTENKGLGPFAKEVTPENVEWGDIIQLAFENRDFVHSLLVVSAPAQPDVPDILVAAHTIDSDYRPLNSYSWSAIRFLHIVGYRK